MINIRPVWYERRSKEFQKENDQRTQADKDYARIIHSASFRRLQGKTQILNLGDSDFYRTRLTHSLEVAQIAVGVVRQIQADFPHLEALLPEVTQMQAIALTHDLGHPPFGHGGEVALNYCMRDNGGFEGNGQTLRLLSRLENFSEKCGVNLTRRTLLGVLKYPASYGQVVHSALQPQLAKTTAIQIIDRKASHPPKCFMDSEQEVVDWVLSVVSESDRKKFTEIVSKEGKHSKTIHKSFDCSIMDLADDIAYGVHDLEDALELNLLSRKQFEVDVPRDVCLPLLSALESSYPEEFNHGDTYTLFVEKLFADGKSRKRQISRLVHYFMTHIEVVEKEGFEEPLLKFCLRISQDFEAVLEALKACVFKRVIRSANVQQMEFKGQKMVVSVFEALASEPYNFLPEDVREIYEESGEDMRIICDYIASMTDLSLMKTYERLFTPRVGSIFDQL